MTTGGGKRDLPDVLAPVAVDGHTLSGDELRSRAEAFASRVRGAGPIAIDATASLSTIVAVLGCLLAGVPAVPVPPDSGPRERAHILRDSGAVLVEDVDRSTPGVDAALILYTSGTTGPPKGVPISWPAITACLDGLADAWAWTPDDTLVHGLPLFHVHGLVLGVLGALLVGSPLIHTGRPTPEAYAAAAGSLYFGFPTVWGRVAADPASAAALSRARLLVSGSAGLPRTVFDALKSLTGQGPLERYGMTETLITLAARADGPRTPGSVGTPVAGVEARLVDVEDGIGSLHVRGATVFDGYLGGPSLDGWFDTGDAASVVDGTYRIVGRARDDLIKSGGYRVGAGEIEAVLLEHPSVQEAAVIGVPDDDLGQRIVAYVVGTGVVPDVLVEHVASQLSVHKRPREVRVVDSLPRNALGKVQKSRL